MVLPFLLVPVELFNPIRRSAVALSYETETESVDFYVEVVRVRVAHLESIWMFVA